MRNSSLNIGRKTQAARRIAGMLMSGALAGTVAAGGAGVIQAGAASWGENADYIFEYLTNELEYSEAAACGIMANIRCESTFNPHAWNAGGGSYGLCQWTGGRYGRLQSWCRSNGYDYTTIDGQLAYLEYELENFYPGVENYLRSVENTSDGAYSAGQYYCYHFEAPASRGSVSVYRGGLASGTFWESYRPAEWYQIDGVWHYILRDGSYQTAWMTIDDDTFYFDQDGNRISGWRTIDGQRYFFEEDGKMATGWKKIDGRSFYFDSDGSLITGILHSGDDWFLLDENGSVQASAAMEEYAPAWIEARAEEEAEIALASAEAEDTAEIQGQEAAAAAFADSKPTAQAALSGGQNADSVQESPVSFVLASAGAQEDEESGQESSVEMLRRAAMAAQAETQAEEDDFLAAADAMQTAALGQEPDEEQAQDQDQERTPEEDEAPELKQETEQVTEEEEDTEEEPEAEEEETDDSDPIQPPFELPTTATELAGSLPVLSNEPIDTEELQDVPTFLAKENDAEDMDAGENADTAAEETIPGPVILTAGEAEDGAAEKDPEASDDVDLEENDTKEAEESEEHEASEESEKEERLVTSDDEKDSEETTGRDKSDSRSDEGKDDSEGDGSAEEDKKDDSAEDKSSENDEKNESAEDKSAEDDQESADDQDRLREEAEESEDTKEEAADEEEKEDDAAEGSTEAPLSSDSADVAKDSSENTISLSDLEAERRQNEGGDTDSRQNDQILITLDRERLPEFTKEDLEDTEKLVSQLWERKILRAVTAGGLDVTPEVTASVKASEEEEDVFVITFEASIGDSTTEINAAVTVKEN